MRRRIQAVGAAGQHRCNGAISLRLTRNGRPGPAVGPSSGEETPQIAARIKGPLHQRISRAVGGSDTVDQFAIFIDGAEETDSFQWVGPAYSDGTEYVVPAITVTFSAPTTSSNVMEVTYSNAVSASVVYFGCFVNGFFFYGNVEIGSVYGP